MFGRRPFILDFLSPRAIDVLRCHLDQVLTGKNVSYEQEAEFDVIRLRRISAAYRPNSAGGGTVDGWLAFVEDVPERSD